MLSRGIVYELPTLGRLIAGNVSSSWPTASAWDHKTVTAPGQRRRQLGEAVQFWPSPDAGVFNDGQSVEVWKERRERELAKKYNGNGGGTPLAMAVRLWPTATAGDGKSSGSRNLEGSEAHAGTSLTDAVVRPDRAWGTPRAGDAKRCRLEGGHTHEVQTKGRLNPDFVEILMGFPVGWTLLNRPRKSPWPEDVHPGWPAPPGTDQHAFEPSRVTKASPHRPSRLKALGNAVVPQVGYVVGLIVKEVLTGKGRSNNE